MQRCAKCLMPESKPGISFDDNGVCNACRNWNNRKYNPDDLQNALAGKKVLLPVSGGKDSLRALDTLEQMGVTPMLICIQPCRITPLGARNLDNIMRQATVGGVIHRVPKTIAKELWASTVDHGKPLQPYDDLLYSIPDQYARSNGYDIVVWGENAAHIYGNVLEPKRNYAASPITNVFLSDYLPDWSPRKNLEVAQKRGLETRNPSFPIEATGGYWAFEQLDDEFPIVSHFFKFIKYGYGRATDQASRDLRDGWANTDMAWSSINTYDGHIAEEYLYHYARFCGQSYFALLDVIRAWCLKVSFTELGPRIHRDLFGTTARGELLNDV